ncbi:hypothetical protein GIB67_015673 [Kingdonia uniflora]|uniref:HMA domain-containing protein n=1 Tax=Kingdonia uniflora TaxID=39325 RepID=A0A7J7NU72_9MAGN|nr:hypothetical protein GIB67_015673 [Kingdonia uniflora]
MRDDVLLSPLQSFPHTRRLLFEDKLVPADPYGKHERTKDTKKAEEIGHASFHLVKFLDGLVDGVQIGSVPVFASVPEVSFCRDAVLDGFPEEELNSVRDGHFPNSLPGFVIWVLRGVLSGVFAKRDGRNEIGNILMKEGVNQLSFPSATVRPNKVSNQVCESKFRVERTWELRKMGFMNHLCSSSSHGHGSFKHKTKPLQTVEIKVKMDCEGCERKVRRAVEGMRGVTQVDVEPKQHKVTVIGYVDPNKVVRRMRRRTGKMAELWPYVPYEEVAHPYAQGVYDKKAPSGFVRKSSWLGRASSSEMKYSNAFSDENPNSCSIM